MKEFKEQLGYLDQAAKPLLDQNQARIEELEHQIRKIRYFKEAGISTVWTDVSKAITEVKREESKQTVVLNTGERVSTTNFEVPSLQKKL